jgi:tetratricopeptide (TPR) repeat protein
VLLDEAEALCRRAIDFLPDVTYAMNNLGHILRIRHRYEEARACFERARLLAAGRAAQPGQAVSPPPQRGQHDNGRGIVPTEHGDPAVWLDPSDEADNHVRPDSPSEGSAEDQHARGLVAWKYGRLEEAEACFREAIRADPTRDTSWLRLARIQEECGDFERSCESARAALAIRPKLAEAYRMLAFVLRGRMPDAEILAMQDMLDDPEVSPDDRALLRFGLAAVLDHHGLFAEAAAHVEAANALQSTSKGERGLAFDPSTGAVFNQRMIAAITPDFLARRRGWGDPDPRPVFVVGLPRSGTTLTEQILASHPQVHGAGELHEVSRIFRSLPELVAHPAVDAFDALERLTPELTRTAARDYLAQIDALAPPYAARVVDKQPDNINHLGLISLLWPGARVIRCRRDLRDVAVSCWQMGLVATSWSNDWDNIARRFRDYQRILAHWDETRPLEWLDLGYEDLVNDLEAQARRMIEFLGLEWDPSCLEFHSNRRVVRTPSLVQVRQPIHSHSVGRWRNYEPFIQPMFHAFERHGVRVDGPEHSRGTRQQAPRP